MRSAEPQKSISLLTTTFLQDTSTLGYLPDLASTPSSFRTRKGFLGILAHAQTVCTRLSFRVRKEPGVEATPRPSFSPFRSTQKEGLGTRLLAHVTPLSLKHVKSKNQDKIGKNWRKKIARFLFWTATNNSKPHLKLERPGKFA